MVFLDLQALLTLIFHKAVGHSLDTKGVKEPVVALSAAMSHVKKSNILRQDLALMVHKV